MDDQTFFKENPEEHTKAKLAILQRYLLAWYPISTKYSDAIYIDCFSGPGKHRSGSKGSPLLALDIFLTHQFIWSKNRIYLTFMDREQEYIDLLNETIEKDYRSKIDAHNNDPNKGTIDIQTKVGEYENLIQIVLKNLGKNKMEDYPVLVFVDPFGFSQFTMNSITNILKYKRNEVIITLMYDNTNRFMDVDHNEKYITALFGDDNWKQLKSIKNPSKKKETFISIYMENLRKYTDVKYILPVNMMNKMNHTVFFLVFCTKNLKGMAEMKNSMSKVVKEEDYKFESLQPGKVFQKSLDEYFINEPSKFQLIRTLIIDKFGDVRPFLIEDLEEYIIGSTPYRYAGIKRGILKPWEAEGKIKVVKSKQNRKKGSFPNGTSIQFVV